MPSCWDHTDFKSRDLVHRSVSCFIFYYLLGRMLSPTHNIICIIVIFAKALTVFAMSGAKQLNSDCLWFLERKAGA